MDPHPLIEVAEQVEKYAKTSKVAVIFDLDSTLFCVSPRIQHILREFAGEYAATYAKETGILKDIEVLPTDWGFRTVLERIKFTASQEFIRDIRNYWRRHFFSSNHLERDKIYPSANEYVKHLHDLGANVLYLTGRPEGSMRTGTREVLATWGFPFFEESRLIMKPSDVMQDDTFKANVLEQLVHDYDHIWFFENEPLIIEQVRKVLPQIHIVYINSVHSGKAAPPEDLPTIGMSYSEGLRKK